MMIKGDQLFNLSWPFSFNLNELLDQPKHSNRRLVSYCRNPNDYLKIPSIRKLARKRRFSLGTWQNIWRTTSASTSSIWRPSTFTCKKTNTKVLSEIVVHSHSQRLYISEITWNSMNNLGEHRYIMQKQKNTFIEHFRQKKTLYENANASEVIWKTNGLNLRYST